MLQIETPLESNYYQNNYDNFQNPNNIQDFKGSSSTISIHENTSKKIQLPKEKIWIIPLLLENPNSKNFQSPVLEIDFLIDSGAESNIINFPSFIAS